MDPQEMALDLDYGQIKLLEKDYPFSSLKMDPHKMALDLEYGQIISLEKDWVCLVLLSVFLYLAALSTKLDLHQPQISERKICRRLKNFGIGIFSIVLVPCGTLPNGFLDLPYQVFRYGHDQNRRLKNVLNVLFRDRIPNGALWFANMPYEMFMYGPGHFVRILILIILFSRNLLETVLVNLQMLLSAIYVVFSRSVNRIWRKIHSWFTIVPCCVPWFVKRPVIVEDHQATSELCLNSPFTGSCTCNLNFPKRPILVVDDTGSSGLAYG